MSNLPQLKQEFVQTNPDEWTIFRKPPIWANTQDEFAITVSNPFGEKEIHPPNIEQVEDAFSGEEIQMGNIRVERRGVPFYEGDFICIGIEDERRYFPHGVTVSGTEMNDFQEHISRVMTESLGYRDYSDVLKALSEADSLGD